MNLVPAADALRSLAADVAGELRNEVRGMRRC
jgi:hypothetical protein